MAEKIFTRADGTTYRSSGYKLGSANPNAKKFKSAGTVSKLPPRVDLRKFMTEVENQDTLGSCTSNAVAGAYEYLVKRYKGIEDYDVSRLFIYYNARVVEDTIDQDDGCYISSAIEGLTTKGACSENTWPYEIEQFTEEPPEEAYQEASSFLVEDVQMIPVELDAWKQALAEGNPIIFGLKLFDSFDKQRKPGLVPAPTSKETNRQEHSGHAMLCVGYSDKDNVFIVRNSWGPDWGDNGYCYIPYSYMMSPEHNFGDSWIIKQLTNFEIDESTWGDDSSITGDFDTELADMTDEDYAEMVDAMGDYPLEFRIAFLIVYAAAADGDVSDEELEEISVYMKDTLEKLGVKMKVDKLMKNVSDHLEEEGLFEESIELLGQYLSNKLLAKILNDIREIIGVDDLNEDEEKFISALTQAWQIEGEDSEEE